MQASCEHGTMNTAESYLARWFAWTRPRVHEICQQIVVMEQAACRCCRYIYIVRMSGLGGLEEVDRPSQMEVGRTTKVPSITEILNIVASKQFPPVPEAQTATKKKKRIRHQRLIGPEPNSRVAFRATHHPIPTQLLSRNATSS